MPVPCFSLSTANLSSTVKDLFAASGKPMSDDNEFEFDLVNSGQSIIALSHDEPFRN